MKFAPKPKDLTKVFNTIFVKNVPANHDTEQGVRLLFEPFGAI